MAFVNWNSHLVHYHGNCEKWCHEVRTLNIKICIKYKLRQSCVLRRYLDSSRLAQFLSRRVEQLVRQVIKTIVYEEPSNTNTYNIKIWIVKCNWPDTEDADEDANPDGRLAFHHLNLIINIFNRTFKIPFRGFGPYSHRTRRTFFCPAFCNKWKSYKYS